MFNIKSPCAIRQHRRIGFQPVRSGWKPNLQPICALLFSVIVRVAPCIPAAATVVWLALAVNSFADEKPSPRTDLAGDALPEGAVARLGTTRWRHGHNVSFVAYADNGKQVLTSCGNGIIYVWDAAAGKRSSTSAR